MLFLIINIVCVYALQPGLSVDEKYRSYEQTFTLVISVIPSETLIIAGDFNSDVGQHSQGFNRHHGGYGCETSNQEGTRILDLSTDSDLAVANTFFRKGTSQLITYNSEGCATLITSWLGE